MPVNKIYADSLSMGIARELLKISDDYEEKAKKLKERHIREVEALTEEVEKSYDENFERLRLSLSLPNKLINPKFDATYLEEFGELYLHHGPEVREATPAETLLSRLFGKSSSVQ